MTPTHLHALNSSLVALPVAVAFARRLLLTHKSPMLVTSSSSGEKLKTTSDRTNHWMEKFNHITAYDHFGLNE
jgi:hypothetical protein